MKFLKKHLSEKLSIINDTIEYIEGLSVSQIFWRIFLYVGFIILMIIDWRVGLVFSGIGSFIYLAAIYDDVEDIFWGPLTLIFWAGLISYYLVKFLVLGIGWLIEHTIIPFNEWLDSFKNEK